MKIYFYLLLFILISCKEASKKIEINDNTTHFENVDIQIDTLKIENFEDTILLKKNETSVKKDTIVKKEIKKDTLIKLNKNVSLVQDTNFVKLDDLSKNFIYDIKYATNDNFLKQKVYDCPECFLRLKTAKAVINANEEFIQLGYRLKVFDCYRPHDVQKKMWAILPGTHYVANPKKGSIHNRGGAIDVTLVDLKGNEIDMGTPFDFFGKEAHHTYTKHSVQIQKNRDLLKNTLKKHGFRSIYSEWWHYEILGARSEKISNFKWKCE